MDIKLFLWNTLVFMFGKPLNSFEKLIKCEKNLVLKLLIGICILCTNKFNDKSLETCRIIQLQCPCNYHSFLWFIHILKCECLTWVHMSMLTYRHSYGDLGIHAANIVCARPLKTVFQNQFYNVLFQVHWKIIICFVSRI
jgi:hypothetical protein